MINRIEAHIAAECKTVDVDSLYDDMLDDCYSFKDVGGPFACMLPSRVLAECDPVAYRCGKNDWLDGEGDRLVEIDGSYYDRDDAETALEEFIDELREAVDAAETDGARITAQAELENAEGYSL